MFRKARSRFSELSLRQILMGSLLTVCLVTLIYGIALLSSLYRAKKESASLQFAAELERQRSTLDRVFFQTDQNAEHLALLARTLLVANSSQFNSVALRNIQELIQGSEMHFSGYVAFDPKAAAPSRFGVVVSKNPRLASHQTFNDPMTFTSRTLDRPVNPDSFWLSRNRPATPPAVTSDFGFGDTPSGQDVVATSSPIRDSEGNFLGVAGIDILIASINSFLDNVQVGQTGGVLLVDSNGQPIRTFLKKSRAILGFPGQEPPIKAVQADDPLTPNFRSVPAFSTHLDRVASYRGQDGEIYVTQTTALRFRPWFLVAYQKSREAYAAPVTHMLVLLFFGGVFFALFFWMGRQLATVLSSSVSNLVVNFNENSSLMADLDRGGKLRPVYPKGPKEFQYLALKLNELYDHLSRTVKELKQEASRAETATAAKSRFLSVMSHEIRTPLNSMLGLTDVLLRTPLNSEQAKYLRVLHRSGESLLRILNDILDFSRLEAGKMELDFHEFDLFELVRSVDQLKRLEAETKGVRFRVLLPKTNYTLLGDSTRLRQILLNLVGNAIKFTPEGEVSLKITPPGGTESQAQSFQFEVTDTGIGIPPTRLQSIFQEFSQADRSISRRFGGTGLGLSITQQLLHLFRSKLEVRSQEGNGSTFSFRLDLPIRAKKPAVYQEESDLRATLRPVPSPEAIATPSGTGTGPRILMVDDDEDNHRLLTAYMKFHPEIRFDHAYNGRDAVEKVSAGSYDLILMDLQMPEMDGLEALRSIRSQEKETHRRRTPIVVVSANTYSDDRRVSLESGADDHIAKPIQLKTFNSVLTQYLTKRA